VKKKNQILRDRDISHLKKKKKTKRDNWSYSPIMQPPKKTAWTNPTLYFSPQTNPHWATVELPAPPTQSHEPGSNPQTLLAISSQPEPRHLNSGSRSANIITIVWKPSSAQAKHVNTKWRNCHVPNSPQCFCNMSSIVSFWTSGPFSGFLAGSSKEDSKGDRRSGSDEGMTDMYNISIGVAGTRWIFSSVVSNIWARPPYIGRQK